ncbi:MAG: hypothetical protein WB624_22740 [Xanthobacteraceae bacterium]
MPDGRTVGAIGLAIDTRDHRRRNEWRACENGAGKSIANAKVRLGPVERKKLIALGYLRSDVAGNKGPAFDVAAEAYLSDRLAEEFVAAV